MPSPGFDSDSSYQIMLPTDENQTLSIICIKKNNESDQIPKNCVDRKDR